MNTTQHFFDSASGFYDRMTGLKAGLDKKQEFYKSVLLPGDTTAADIGCGTGKDSIALALLGLTVTGYDLSNGMVDKARENAQLLNAQAEFVAGPFRPQHNTCNIITCFGNTLALIPPEDLKQLFRDIFVSLLPGGRFVFQMLNYIPLVERKDKNIVITRNGDETYIRFYEYIADAMLFNILTTGPEEKGKHLITTRLYPATADELNALLTDAGFTNVTLWGSIGRAEFAPHTSPDVVGCAVR